MIIINENYMKVDEKELIIKHLNCCPPGDVPMTLQSSRYLQWTSKRARKHIKHTTRKTLPWFKSRIQIFLSHTLINTFLPFFLLTGGWCEKKENAREATPAGKRKSRIITSGAVGPYEPWEAVTGTCHALSVAIAVVRALGDGICEQGREAADYQ